MFARYISSRDSIIFFCRLGIPCRFNVIRTAWTYFSFEVSHVSRRDWFRIKRDYQSSDHVCAVFQMRNVDYGLCECLGIVHDMTLRTLAFPPIAHARSWINKNKKVVMRLGQIVQFRSPCGAKFRRDERLHPFADYMTHDSRLRVAERLTHHRTFTVRQCSDVIQECRACRNV